MQARGLTLRFYPVLEAFDDGLPSDNYSGRLLAARVGERFRSAEPASLFRKFVEASATVDISDHQIVVTLGHRARNPHLIEAGYSDSGTSIPWLHNRALKINFA